MVVDAVADAPRGLASLWAAATADRIDQTLRDRAQVLAGLEADEAARALLVASSRPP